MSQCLSLYQIVRHKSATVATVLGSIPLNVSFHRALVDPNFILWHNLVARLIHVQLRVGNDIFRWNLNSFGHSTIQSMYRYLIKMGPCFIKS
jgi:hypothetical protein